MSVEFVDFKTVDLKSKLDTTIGAELKLTQTGRVSAKAPEEWSGFVFLYLNIKINDPEETYFVFDITTETVVKVSDDITELDEAVMQEGVEIAQAKTFEAIKAISIGMGINEIDLAAQG